MSSKAIFLSVNLIIALFASTPFLAGAAFGDTSTFIGKVYDGDGKKADKAYFDFPQGFAADTKGNLYIADTWDNVIRKIDTKRVTSTYAGTGEFSRDDGLRVMATFGHPEGIDRDSKTGTIYVADTGNNAIRKIEKGLVTTVGIFAAPAMRSPTDVVVDGSTLYIADTGNSRIIKVSKNGGGSVLVAKGLSTPLKMVMDGSVLYVSEFSSGNVLEINTINGSKRVFASKFVEPKALAIYGGNLYVSAGQNGVWNEIWKVNLKTRVKKLLIRRRETEWLNNGIDMLIRMEKDSVTKQSKPIIYQIQGGGSSIFTFDIDGKNEQKIAGKHRYAQEFGKRVKALIGHPQGLAASPDGKKIYIAFAQGNMIAVYDTVSDRVSFGAGHPMDSYTEAKSNTARFSDVASMTVSPDGKILYVVDRNNNRIRKVNTTTWKTRYLTGAGFVNSDAETDNGYQEGGPCQKMMTLKVRGCAYFNRPTGLAITKDGKTLYVADGSNNRIRRVDIRTGRTAFVAGSGKMGFQDGVGGQAVFNGPFTLTLSQDEKTLYVADKNNHAIREIILATRRVTTLAGNGKIGYREGPFSKAVFAIPEYIQTGPDGNLYVTEAGRFDIRKLDLAKKTTSLVSGSGQRGKVDGAGFLAEWNIPKGFTFIGNTMYVTDFRNDLIRAVDVTSSM